MGIASVRVLGAACFLWIACGIGAENAYSADDSNTNNAPQRKEEKKLPATGMIAGSKTGAYGSTQIDGQWGGTDIQGDKLDPVSGSVNKLDANNWLLKLFNNTKDEYSVSLQVIQFDLRNRELKSDAFSAVLKGGQKLERKFPANPSSVNAAVKLNNWKMTPRKKTQEELKQELEQKKAEIADIQKELPAEIPAPPAKKGKK